MSKAPHHIIKTPRETIESERDELVLHLAALREGLDATQRQVARIVSSVEKAEAALKQHNDWLESR